MNDNPIYHLTELDFQLTLRARVTVQKIQDLGYDLEIEPQPDCGCILRTQNGRTTIRVSRDGTVSMDTQVPWGKLDQVLALIVLP